MIEWLQELICPKLVATIKRLENEYKSACITIENLNEVIRQKGSGSVSMGQPLKPIEKNSAAVALGRLGGLKGGNARAAKLTAERKSEIASAAAKQRWTKDKGEKFDS